MPTTQYPKRLIEVDLPIKRKWGQCVKEEAEKELAEFYPKDPDASTPIAYLWARTIICEGPGCGAEVPLMRSLWLVKKSHRSIALQIIPKPEDKRVDFEIIDKLERKDLDFNFLNPLLACGEGDGGGVKLGILIIMVRF